jgi:hypothetical protein
MEEDITISAANAAESSPATLTYGGEHLSEIPAEVPGISWDLASQPREKVMASLFNWLRP